MVRKGRVWPGCVKAIFEQTRVRFSFGRHVDGVGGMYLGGKFGRSLSRLCLIPSASIYCFACDASITDPAFIDTRFPHTPLNIIKFMTPDPILRRDRCR